MENLQKEEIQHAMAVQESANNEDRKYPRLARRFLTFNFIFLIFFYMTTRRESRVMRTNNKCTPRFILNENLEKETRSKSTKQEQPANDIVSLQKQKSCKSSRHSRRVSWTLEQIFIQFILEKCMSMHLIICSTHKIKMEWKASRIASDAARWTAWTV